MMTPDTPRITLLMPVYNGEKYLRVAIDSLLQQTYKNFELLIIDDGSSDNSIDIVKSYSDSRIRFDSNGRNLGLIATLNKGFDLAQGEFIARMDCDDISLPKRLERQLQYLEQNPDVGLVGSWFEKMQGSRSTTVKTPVDDASIRFFLLFDNAFLHSSILLRRSLVERMQLRFDTDFPYAEDYELWARISRHTRVANLPEVLVRYRDHAENTSNRFRKEQNATADRVRRQHLTTLGLYPDDTQLELHLALTNFQFKGGFDRLNAARDWLNELLTASRQSLNLPDDFLHGELDRYWYGACGTQADAGIKVWQLFRDSPLGQNASLEWQLKLLLRCLLRRPIA